jgi:hypothetical protein
MQWQEYDSAYGDGDDFRTGRSRRTKFRESEYDAHAKNGRSKRPGKRSHRQKTIKDDYGAIFDR